MMQLMLAMSSLVPLPFLNLAWTSGSSQFTYFWSLAYRILSMTFITCWMGATVQYFEKSLALPFFGIVMKIDHYQSCGLCWVFQICWHIDCSTLTTSFRIWNSSAGIPSPTLALFVVMFCKAHLTLCFLMSVCRWLISPSLFPRWLKYFLFSFSGHSC